MPKPRPGKVPKRVLRRVLAPNGVPRKVPKKCFGVCASVENSTGEGTRSTFFGTFLGTLFGAGTLQSTLFGAFLVRGFGTSLDGRHSRNTKAESGALLMSHLSGPEIRIGNLVLPGKSQWTTKGPNRRRATVKNVKNRQKMSRQNSTFFDNIRTGQKPSKCRGLQSRFFADFYF